MKVTEPCHENFNSMNKAGDGRYCGSCNKMVIDFTKKSETEIKDYFRKHANQSVCGRFKGYQLESRNRFEQFLISVKKHGERIRFKPMRLAFLGLIACLFTLSGCFMGKAYTPVKAYEPEKFVSDSVKTNQHK
jgi:hypothetical protein